MYSHIFIGREHIESIVPTVLELKILMIKQIR